MTTGTEAPAGVAASPGVLPNSWHALWRWIPEQDRELAAATFWKRTANSEQSKRDAVEYLAALISFRAKSVAQFAPDRAGSVLARRGKPPERLIVAFLVALHVEHRRELLEQFLDVAGIPHEHGAIEPGVSVTAQPGKVAAAAKAVLGIGPSSGAMVLLATLRLMHAGLTESIESALRHRATTENDAGVTSHTEIAANGGVDTEAATEVEVDALPGAAASSPRPDAGSFTKLDRVLIDVAIAAVSEQEGAFDLAGALELVDEVAHLNPKRHRSYFHLGFVDALAARQIAPDRFPEANLSRFGWYLGGAILGLARRGEYAAIADLWTTNQARTKGLLDGSHDGAGEVVPVLFDAVFRARSPSDAFALLDGGGIARAGRPFVGRLLHEIATLVQTGRAVEARRVIEEVQFAIMVMVEDGIEVPGWVTSDLERRIAQCHQIQGEFDEAVAGFQRLLPNAVPEQAGAVEVDLGLAKCRLRGLGDLKVPDDEADWPPLTARLEAAELHLSKALEFDSSRRAHAEFCLGVLELVQDHHSAAQPHLERALVELAQQPETYGPLGVLPRLRLYLGYCLAAAGDPIRSDEAVRLVEEAVKELPPTEGTALIARTVELLAMSAPDAAGRLASSLHGARGEALLRAACEGELLRRHPELCDSLVRRAGDVTRSSKARFADWRIVLRESLAASRPNQARDALDALEELAQEPALCDQFEQLLSDSSNYDPAWAYEDAEIARVSMLETIGQVAAAAAILKQLGHAAISRGGFQAVEIALAYLERIATYGAGHEVDDLRDRAEAVERQLVRPQGTPTQTAAQLKGVIFVVGGNETQARQEQAIRDTVARSWPGLKLEFEFTGWSSNWQRRLDAFERQLRNADAVVLLQKMRTTLGQTARRICGEESIPWIPCPGHGRQSIVGAVARAADVMMRGGVGQ